MVASKIGFLFPGQGAQFVGMGKEWADQYERVRQIYREAGQILNYSLSQLCFEGPEEKLTRTLYAQPAIFVTSLALLTVLENQLGGIKPDLAAGLSLGEFSALVAAGSLSLSEGLSLVQKRAELMEEAASKNPGTMVSIVGLSQQDCAAIARESGAELANLNAPDQFVLSGREPHVEKAAQLAEQKGAKRTIQLKVGGAFHSTLMEEARQGLWEALQKVSIRPPQSLFIPNATAQIESSPERIRILLADQLTSPVRWIETMELARTQGIRNFIELGPSHVLKGLAKRIDPSLQVLSFEKTVDLEALGSALERI